MRRICFWMVLVIGVTTSCTSFAQTPNDDGPFLGTAYVGEDGHLVASSGLFPFFGIEFLSEGGYLIPPGDDETDPFEFFLVNTPQHITYQKLGIRIELNEVKLSVRYDPPPGVLPSEDLTGNCAAVATPCPIRILDVPEPATGLLALFALVSLSRFRHDRRKSF